MSGKLLRGRWRSAANVIALSAVVSAVVTSTILGATSLRMASAQSGIVFQKAVCGENLLGGADVAVDSLDNIYVVGSGERHDPVNPSYLVVFLLKFDSTGTLVWQRLWSRSSGTASVGAVTVDALGNAYVVGWTSSLPSEGRNDIFLLKFNASGSLVWERIYGSPDNDEGLGVATDPSGNIYVTGGISFGRGSWDVLLLKCDSSGDVIWQRTWGGTSSDHGQGVAVDSSGTVYVTGTTHSFGPGLSNMFLLRLDSAGNLIWQKTWAPQESIATGDAVAVDSSGFIYVTGEYSSPFRHDPDNLLDLLLLKFSSSGSLVWQRTWDSGDWDRSEGIAVDSTGGVYVAGFYTERFHGLKAILAKFDTTGNHTGVVAWGYDEQAAERGFGVAVDSLGDALVTGDVGTMPGTISHPNGTIDAPPFSPLAPRFTLDTPTFPLQNFTGTLETPTLREASNGTARGLFLVKFMPPDYTQKYTERTADAFGLSPIVFTSLLIAGTVAITAASTSILLRRRRATSNPPPQRK